jgi:hypothetical protein
MNKQDLLELGSIRMIFSEHAPYWRVRLSKHCPCGCGGKDLPVGSKGDGVFGFDTREQAKKFIADEVEPAFGEALVATCLLTHEGRFMTQAAFNEENRIAKNHEAIMTHGYACYIAPIAAATADEKRNWLLK